MTNLLCTVAVWVLASQELDYERVILPILSDNCFYCHGPDAKHREAGIKSSWSAKYAKRTRSEK